MRRTSGPTTVVVSEIEPGDELIAYRIVRSDIAGDPVLLNSFRSNFELERPPRNRERAWTVIHMGISAYLDEPLARGTAETWRKLGDYIAELHLRPDQGFNFARTGHPGHLTIWADPVKLHEVTVDIRPV
jgi:hypothetical protein